MARQPRTMLEAKEQLKQMEDALILSKKNLQLIKQLAWEMIDPFEMTPTEIHNRVNKIRVLAREAMRGKK